MGEATGGGFVACRIIAVLSSRVENNDREGNAEMASCV